MQSCNFKGGGRLSPALFCLLLALAALACWPNVAAADHPNDTPATAMLGEKPQSLNGITAQVRDTQGPQLVVENTTGKTLEVYNANGVPFLRIGPDGVEANRKAKTFYETFGPEGIIVPEKAGNSTVEEARSSPDWVKVSDQRSWGWFDHRLQTEGMEVPEEVSHAEQPTDFGSWEVPVKLGEDETALEGSYRYEPEPQGTYVAELTSEGDLSSVTTQLSQGYGGASALLLQNEGEEPVTVMDGSGDPAIEIGPDRVRVNVKSPVGQEANRSAGTTAAQGKPPEQSGQDSPDPEWKTVAGGSSFTWQDPRLQPPDGQAQPPDSNVGQSQQVSGWEIPIQSSGDSSRVQGEIRWEPLEGSTTSPGQSGHDHSGHEHSQDSQHNAGSGNEGSTGGNNSAGDVFEAQLAELNGSGVSGNSHVEFQEANRVEVTVEASELEPGQTHELHIHGLESGEQASCPTGAEAGHHEMESAVGQHALDLEPYPEADGEGNVSFEATFPQAGDDLEPLEDKALVIHGMNADGGYDQEMPVACGEFAPANGESGSIVPTALLSAVGANGVMLYGLLALAVLAVPAAGFAMLRRRR